MHTKAPMAAVIPTVRAIALVDFPFWSILPYSNRVIRCFSFGRPSGNSTSTSWCKSTMSYKIKDFMVILVYLVCENFLSIDVVCFRAYLL